MTANGSDMNSEIGSPNSETETSPLGTSMVGTSVPASPVRRVLILMSDTGGGHRAAGEAISAALRQRHGDSVQVTLIDVFKDYTPFPFNRFPQMYPYVIRRGRLSWALGYRLSDRRSQARLVMASVGRIVQRALPKLFRDYPADVVVCVHPLLNTPALTVLRRMGTTTGTSVPYVTVVTDLVSTHTFWFDRKADRILVPTDLAYEKALRIKTDPAKLRVTGLPINPRFVSGLMAKPDARAKLAWDADLPAILLIGGGEGMGPLWNIANRLNRLGLHCQLAIVAGRNQALKAKLDAVHWTQPTHIYGFVTNMPELMAAADLLITKAGPSTIMEACAAGLPMILSDAIPGQETGNVRYIQKNQAGLYARGSRRVARAVKMWFAQGTELLQQRADNARRLARPDAVWVVADEIWALIDKKPREVN